MADSSNQSFIVWDDDLDLSEYGEDVANSTPANTTPANAPNEETRLADLDHTSSRADGNVAVKVEETNNFFGNISNEQYKWESEDEKLDDKRTKRIKGGRIAVPKKICADIDSEDEMILDMHSKGIADVDIAKALQAEGRTTYNPKTIHSRYTRIRAARATRRDMLLEEELTDWHNGEDEILLEAVASADEMIEQEISKLKARRWDHVARNLYMSKPKSTYSAKACKRRFQELQTGTARIPPELDDDRDARAALLAQRKAAFEQKEIEERAAKLEAAERARKQQEDMFVARNSKRYEQQQKKREREEQKLDRAYEHLARTRAAIAKVGKRQAATSEKLERHRRASAKDDEKADLIREEHRVSHANAAAADGEVPMKKPKVVRKAPDSQREQRHAKRVKVRETEPDDLLGLLKPRGESSANLRR